MTQSIDTTQVCARKKCYKTEVDMQCEKCQMISFCSKSCQEKALSSHKVACDWFVYILGQKQSSRQAAPLGSSGCNSLLYFKATRQSDRGSSELGSKRKRYESSEKKALSSSDSSKNVELNKAAIRHAKKGLSQKKLKKLDLATLAFTKAYTCYSMIKNWKMAAKMLIELGIIKREQNQHDRALIFFDRAAKVFTKEDSQNGDLFAKTLHLIHTTFYNLGLYVESEVLLEATKHRILEFSLIDQVKFYFNVAKNQLGQDRLPIAADTLSKGIEVLENYTDVFVSGESYPKELTEFVPNLYLLEAEVLLKLKKQLGLFSDTEKLIPEVHDGCKEMPSLISSQSSSSSSSSQSSSTSLVSPSVEKVEIDFKKAIRFYLINKTDGNIRKAHQVLKLLENFYSKTKQMYKMKKAKIIFDKNVRDIYQSIPSVIRTGFKRHRGPAGNKFREKGFNREPEDFTSFSLKNGNGLPVSTELAKEYSRKGMDALSARNFSEAREILQKALSLYTKFNNQVKKACCIHQIGVTYREEKQYELAIATMMDAVKVFSEITPPGFDCFANAVFDINLCYTRQGLFQLSLDLLESNAPYYPKFPMIDQAKYMYNKGLSHLELRNFLFAVHHFDKSQSMLAASSPPNERVYKEILDLSAPAYLHLAESVIGIFKRLGGFEEVANRILETSTSELEGPLVSYLRSNSSSLGSQMPPSRKLQIFVERAYIKVHNHYASYDTLENREIAAFSFQQLVEMLFFTNQIDKLEKLLGQIVLKRLAWVNDPRYQSHLRSLHFRVMRAKLQAEQKSLKK